MAPFSGVYPDQRLPWAALKCKSIRNYSTDPKIGFESKKIGFQVILGEFWVFSMYTVYGSDYKIRIVEKIPTSKILCFLAGFVANFMGFNVNIDINDVRLMPRIKICKCKNLHDARPLPQQLKMSESDFSRTFIANLTSKSYSMMNFT